MSAPRADGKPLHALPGTARKPVPMLGYSPTLALAQILQDGLGRSGNDMHLHVVTESDFAESLHEQALQGVGVAWLPRALIASDLKAKRLVPAQKQTAGIRFEIRMYRPRNPRNALADGIWRATTG